ncbi:MAG: lauroyl acyltransferase, partial [Pseudomonadota bacterium]
RAESNLALIYPDWPAEKRKAVLKDICENIGRTAGEFAHLKALSEGNDGARVSIIGAERLPLDDAPPAIFVSSHAANWEVIPATFHKLGVKNAFVYRAANNPLTDEFIIRHRASVMSRRQIPKGKRGGRALVDNLKAGRSLMMLVDQKLNSGIEAPFMGRPAMTAPAAARLSLKYGVPIVPVTLVRLKGATFRMTIEEPLPFSPSSDLNADVHALTAKINDKLSADIHAQPGQWLWFHRRWPTSST